MRRREFVAGVGAAATQPMFGSVHAANSRPLIAILFGSSLASGAATPLLNGFARGMRELGYVEGRDFDIVSRSAEGYLPRIPALVEDLMRLQPIVFLTGSVDATVAIMRATTSIPIVNVSIPDPSLLGLGSGQSRPGRQVTGILVSLDSLAGKQVDLLLKLLPGISRLGFLAAATNAASQVNTKRAEAAAALLGVSLAPVEIRSPDEIDAAFGEFERLGAQAVLLPPETVMHSERKRIADLAKAAHLPTMCSYRENVEVGGLMSYGINLPENWRRVATYVDKILKGAKPDELPLEFPTKLELVINFGTAKALGIVIPPALLANADEIIE